MIINRVWAMPNKNTFDVKPIGLFVKKYLLNAAISVDPFARDSKLATYTNDLNPETSAQFHMDAVDFLKKLYDDGVQADLILLDPPYSLHQVTKSYDGYGDKRVIALTPVYDYASKIISKNGFILNFGFNTNGIGGKRGFEIDEILLVAHGGHHNDTICMAEKRKAT